MIPPFQKITGTLPPGIHLATWEEVVTRYGYNKYRQRLLSGLAAALHDLRAAGCRRIYLDGSFITDKPLPGDFDCCWLRTHVDRRLLTPELLDLEYPRTAQKNRYLGEIFPADLAANLFGTPYLEYFQHDDRLSKPTRKGIIAIIVSRRWPDDNE